MLNFAILTAGNIASKMAATVQKMPSVHCYAVAARNEQNAKAFAEAYGFERWYGSYDALFADPHVDIVYIGSPHSHHYQQAKQAILAKKHVLCEKPMTVNAAQAEELFALAKENNVVLAEATWTRYMPFVPALKQLLEQGAIGIPLSITCSFGFPVSDRARMASPELAGGALLDLGIYPLTMASILFGNELQKLSGYCTKTQAGVDAFNKMYLTFSGGETAELDSNMLEVLDNNAIIHGEKGTITVPSFWCAEQFIVQPKDGEPVEYNFPHQISGYEYEVASICNAIENGLTECPEMPHKDTLCILNWMDTLRQQWGIHFPCED